MSLRLSSLIQPSGTDFSYFDIPTKRDTILVPKRLSIKLPAIEVETGPEPAQAKEVVRPLANSRRPSSQAIPQLDAPGDNDDGGDNDEVDDAESPMYLLQPRTYTPVPPAPLPSPRLRVASPEQQRPGPEPQKVDREPQPRQRSSLRQRVSLKTNPPESIHVPPPNAPELTGPRGSSQVYQGPDSAYGSDAEPAPTNSRAAAETSPTNLSPPVFLRPGPIPSPYSDQHNFRPVQASPHSPLQQRPHTSHSTLHPVYPHQRQLRNTPTAMNMSMLSNEANASTESVNTKKLKKKRSALGWLKKAFALDEEERALFEQRRQQQVLDSPYYERDSPRFLDGRRIR